MRGNEYQPITWFKRLPIYATTLLTGLFIVGLCVSAILLSGWVDAWLALGFFTPAFFSGWVWQAVTYPFVDELSFFTPLCILCFYAWGTEVERYLGRPRFLKLFICLVLAPPLVCSLWWAFGVKARLMGSYDISAAMLIAFATLYPNVEYFGWIPLKWFAFTCVAVGSLMYFPSHNWIGLSVLWSECALAFGYVRLLQRGHSVELRDYIPKRFRPKPKFSVVPRPRVEREESGVPQSIDLLLEKISRHGLASLTSKERAALERARARLLKEEKKR